eukprot:1663785-Rhodomonas_salina.1
MHAGAGGGGASDGCTSNATAGGSRTAPLTPRSALASIRHLRAPCLPKKAATITAVPPFCKPCTLVSEWPVAQLSGEEHAEVPAKHNGCNTNITFALFSMSAPWPIYSFSLDSFPSLAACITFVQPFCVAIKVKITPRTQDTPQERRGSHIVLLIQLGL